MLLLCLTGGKAGTLRWAVACLGFFKILGLVLSLVFYGLCVSRVCLVLHRQILWDCV